jgi:diguanylate cyclase (GGDEF)-like protein/PAS domain S-box-containing protein
MDGQTRNSTGQHREQAPEPASSARVAESRIRVLVVDDDQGDFELARRILDRSAACRFEVQWACSYESGLAMLCGGAFDVALVDYQLGASNGIDLLSEAAGRGCSCPMILLTGQDQNLDQEAMLVGAADYLLKSEITPGLLSRSIRYAIERRRRESALHARPVIIYSVDVKTRRTNFISETVRQVVGYSPQEILQTPAFWLQRVHPDDRERLQVNGAALMERGHSVTEYRVRHADGSYLWVHDQVRLARDESGAPHEIIGFTIDITERKQIEAALQESEERYALAMRGANDGLWDWNLDSGEVFYSPRWKAMMGYAESEVGSSSDEWLQRVHTEDAPQLFDQLARHREGRSEFFEAQHRMLHHDGTYRWMLSRGIASRDGQGRAHRMAGSLTDVTEFVLLAENHKYDALHDALTGLANRALFLDRLQHALEAQKRRPDHRCAVLFLDLDKFKQVNDTWGHMAGDRMLKSVAQRLKEALRTVDTVARLGGDEFAVLLADVKTPEGARCVAQRVLDALQNPIVFDDNLIPVRSSIGIALNDGRYLAADDILRDADAALYAAKEAGRGRYAFFEPEPLS